MDDVYLLIDRIEDDLMFLDEQPLKPDQKAIVQRLIKNARLAQDFNPTPPICPGSAAPGTKELPEKTKELPENLPDDWGVF